MKLQMYLRATNSDKQNILTEASAIVELLFITLIKRTPEVPVPVQIMILKDFKKDPMHNTFLRFKIYADPNTDAAFSKIVGSSSKIFGSGSFSLCF
jgi:hypothetical protein